MVVLVEHEKHNEVILGKPDTIQKKVVSYISKADISEEEFITISVRNPYEPDRRPLIGKRETILRAASKHQLFEI